MSNALFTDERSRGASAEARILCYILPRDASIPKRGAAAPVLGIKKPSAIHNHLLDSGVAEDHIIEIALDDRSNKSYRDPDAILKFIKESIKDKEDYYIILDEVQYLDEFEDVLNCCKEYPC